MFASPKSIQAMVAILENLHVIIEKTPIDDTRADVFPMLFNAFDSMTIQIQSAALMAVINVHECLDDASVRRILMPKIKIVFDKNPTDIKMVLLVLQCIERILDKMEKSQVNKPTIANIGRVFECCSRCVFRSQENISIWHLLLFRLSMMCCRLYGTFEYPIRKL